MSEDAKIYFESKLALVRHHSSKRQERIAELECDLKKNKDRITEMGEHIVGKNKTIAILVEALEEIEVISSCPSICSEIAETALAQAKGVG